ncbi:MAG: NAD-dependent epimerase/dehydratase family protein [Bryobacteraceae bacterium]
MQTVFVTGAAGFIGSNLVDRLLAMGKRVVGWDNLSTGRMQFLQSACDDSRFQLVRGDNLDLAALTAGMRGCDFVVHLAANADVRFGVEHPSKDFEQNTRATFHVLEAMRANRIHSLAFSSTGSIYGEADVIPTPENYAFPTQTSLYGASKLAGEGMIQAYCEGFRMNAYLFRFVSILGPRYSHGHVIDFYRQLTNHPDRLDVLGDGTQRKSYLHVDDCLDAIFTVIEKNTATGAKHGVQVYNLGTNEYCQVRDSIGWICHHLGISPSIAYSGGDRGWIGDNPFIFLDTAKIRGEGWEPKFTIRESVIATLRWIEANRWVLAQ